MGKDIGLSSQDYDGHPGGIGHYLGTGIFPEGADDGRKIQGRILSVRHWKRFGARDEAAGFRLETERLPSYGTPGQGSHCQHDGHSLPYGRRRVSHPSDDRGGGYEPGSSPCIPPVRTAVLPLRRHDFDAPERSGLEMGGVHSRPFAGSGLAGCFSGLSRHRFLHGIETVLTISISFVLLFLAGSSFPAGPYKNER